MKNIAAEIMPGIAMAGVTAAVENGPAAILAENRHESPTAMGSVGVVLGEEARPPLRSYTTSPARTVSGITKTRDFHKGVDLKFLLAMRRLETSFLSASFVLFIYETPKN